MAFEFIQDNLLARQRAGLLRSLAVVDKSTGAMIEVNGQHYLNFSSNDYLGQRQNPQVMQAYLQGVVDYGTGSGASPLVTGHSRAHQNLEDYLADLLGYEAVLLFNSGYAANQALCQALFSQNVSVVADKLMHASFNEGAIHHASQFKRFKHNDLTHLEQHLSKVPGDCVVATEGVFSMDGDEAPLQEMSKLTIAKNAWLMVDDAHGFGVLGSRGLGAPEKSKLSSKQVPIYMGTFGKAIGTSGAFVASSRAVIDYLINYAKHFIYSTAMPPAQAVATQASIESLQNGEARQQLEQNIRLFTQLCEQAGIAHMPSQSAIQPVVVEGPSRCVKVSLSLKELGIWVTAMRYPTVPKGQERLRITLSASHQSRDIEALVDALSLCLSQSTKLDYADE